jgi:hypothetical protein
MAFSDFAGRDSSVADPDNPFAASFRPFLFPAALSGRKR